MPKISVICYNIFVERKRIMNPVFIPIIFTCVIFVPMIALAIVSMVRLNQHLTAEVNGHRIEIVTGYSYARLIIDGNIVDEMNSFQMHSAKLIGQLDGVEIKVNIGVGFMGRKITTIYGGVRSEALSN